MKTPARSIILCGIKHCGKSTQGKRLAAALGLDFYDTDDLIYEQTGMDARAIYKSHGKEAFMQAELKACEYLRDTLQAKGSQDQEAAAFGQPKNRGASDNSSQAQEAAAAKSAVIATGGGICENIEAVKILKALGAIVYLQIEEAAACDRIIREARFLPDGTIQNLPAYIANKNPSDKQEVRAAFHNFYVERTKKYKSLADVSVQMQGSRSENTKKILSALGQEH